MGKKDKLDASRKLCKIAKDDLIADNIREYAALVQQPAYVCLKCGRVANLKDNLCKAEKLS